MVLLALVGCGTLAEQKSQPPWMDPSLPIEERAEALANSVPLKDIASQMACGNYGCDASIPSLNVSGFNWSGETCHGLLLCGLCGNATGEQSCDLEVSLQLL